MGRKSLFSVNMLALALLTAAVRALPVFADGGVVLLNQSKVNAAGGFPYKIAVPGSYRLAGNLSVTGTVDAVDAIDVTAAPVTIDLNGFTISGVYPVSVVGINGSSGSLTVLDGTVQGFTEGIQATAGPVTVHDVTIQFVSFGLTSNVAAELTRVAVGPSNFGVGCFSGTCLISNCTIDAARTGLAQNSGGLVAIDNVVRSQNGYNAFLVGAGPPRPRPTFATISGNSITVQGGTAIATASGAITGFGRNVITTNGGQCFSGGTSLGDNVCDGKKQ